MISIHAPARGATSISTSIPGIATDFNPRSREGSDMVAIINPNANPTISIHAPARGATTANSTENIEREFQSTLPRGERHGINVRG